MEAATVAKRMASGPGQDSADFEDDRGALNKEARYRRHTLKIYNKRRDDFDDDHHFDNYLEEVEDIVFNLANDIDVEETKAKVEMYRRKNQDVIGQNQALRSEEERRAAEFLARSERERVAALAALRKHDAELEEQARRERREVELEEMQRVALGAEEAARLKKKKDKQLARERRRQEKEEAEAAAARARAAEVDTKPMYFRPAFPNPPPRVIPESQPADAAMGEATALHGGVRAAAGGWRPETEVERASREFNDALKFAAG